MISQEKLDWMEKVGMKKFKEPMEYYCMVNGQYHLYTEKGIKEKPLEKLEAEIDNA